ncbi:hypothetical protein TVAG_007120 [Trichomonas vaginalis G3]|uniref:Uncharacterized protein n=1 Tax=Trichomonas vaginalis (strain ATCC PRA-98 / G3) TaxID=412133 RepID=A2F4H3_TRIV3|nr:hypothetical protein TVAGG3_0421960 [Trichomonas vaginalis G3]EAY00182.1 hypothetical protein TVAG_007120 [Trichomonas vaginalis G3]KAI5536134.1 hypothetical protein TVAGG3_0421960 [Trichomonas vaginalis G3]|eukprot:XP_001313111.1 hypothetical protein [Trichomonas vaginalis G3]
MNKSEKPTPNRIVTKRLGPKHLSLNPQRHPNIEKQVTLSKEEENAEINELKIQKSKLNQEIIELEIDHSKRISEMTPSQFDSILLSSRNHFLSNLSRATVSYNERLSRMNTIMFSLNEELSRFNSSKPSMTSSFTSSEIKRENVELKRSIDFVRKEIEVSNDASEIIVTSKDSVVARDREDVRSEKQLIRDEINLIKDEIEVNNLQSDMTAQYYWKAIESIKAMQLKCDDEIQENIEQKRPISRTLFDNAESILEKRRRAQSEYYEAKKESGSPQKEEKLQNSLNDYRATIALLPNLSVSELYDNLSLSGTKLNTLNDTLKRSVTSSVMLHSDLIDQQIEEIEKRCHSEILQANVDLQQSSKEILNKIKNEIVKNEYNKGELKTIFRWAQSVQNSEISNHIHQIFMLVNSPK